MERIVLDICSFLISNINDAMSLEKIENYIYYNRCYIARAFKEYTGYTIIEFINLVRVLKSIDPLIYTDETILKIALTNGFNSQEYYSEKFKDLIGISPIKFRKIYANLDKIESKEKVLKLEYYRKSLEEYKIKLMNNEVRKNEKRLVKIAS